MKQDLRKAGRKPIHHICWIVSDSDHIPKQCQLLDVSDLGARLAYDDPSDVPDQFILLLTANGKAARRCEIVRRSNTEIALRFLGKVAWTPPDGEAVEP